MHAEAESDVMSTIVRRTSLAAETPTADDGRAYRPSALNRRHDPLSLAMYLGPGSAAELKLAAVSDRRHGHQIANEHSSAVALQKFSPSGVKPDFDSIYSCFRAGTKGRR